jgi:DNA polymerase-3 subunit epsilon
MSKVYLDFETTGFSKENGDMPVSVAIIDDAGEVLLNTLINPQRDIPQEASDIHGITADTVIDAPTYEEVLPKIEQAITGNDVVIYNRPFDLQWIPEESRNLASSFTCAMRDYAQLRGIENTSSRYDNPWKFHSLTDAAWDAGHDIGDAHNALSDVKATRAVTPLCDRTRTAEASDPRRDFSDTVTRGRQSY